MSCIRYILNNSIISNICICIKFAHFKYDCCAIAHLCETTTVLVACNWKRFCAEISVCGVRLRNRTLFGWCCLSLTYISAETEDDWKTSLVLGLFTIAVELQLLIPVFVFSNYWKPNACQILKSSIRYRSNVKTQFVAWQWTCKIGRHAALEVKTVYCLSFHFHCFQPRKKMDTSCTGTPAVRPHLSDSE